MICRHLVTLFNRKFFLALIALAVVCCSQSYASSAHSTVIDESIFIFKEKLGLLIQTQQTELALTVLEEGKDLFVQLNANDQALLLCRAARHLDHNCLRRMIELGGDIYSIEPIDQVTTIDAFMKTAQKHMAYRVFGQTGWNQNLLATLGVLIAVAHAYDLPDHIRNNDLKQIATNMVQNEQMRLDQLISQTTPLPQVIGSLISHF
ncbi:MAG: hypothetical protein HQK53_06475 [Oligoflexia bacterium]|nr:hypothetical protein [Oligoflexia bacterium]